MHGWPRLRGLAAINTGLTPPCELIGELTAEVDFSSIHLPVKRPEPIIADHERTSAAHECTSAVLLREPAHIAEPRRHRLLRHWEIEHVFFEFLPGFLLSILRAPPNQGCLYILPATQEQCLRFALELKNVINIVAVGIRNLKLTNGVTKLRVKIVPRFSTGFRNLPVSTHDGKHISNAISSEVSELKL